MKAELGRRLMALFRRWQFDAGLEEEMRLHQELREQEQVERGVSPEEARYASQRRFGNKLVLREESRDMWGWNWLETFLQDVRYGLRQLRHNPGFAAVVVITLALGIGANTAIFSAIQAVMLNALPVKDPQQLVVLEWKSERWPARVSETGMTSSEAFSYQSFEVFRAQRRAFSSVFAFVPLGFGNTNTTVFINGQARLAGGDMVSGGYFSGLGVHAYLGRALDEQDEKRGAPGVAVISYRYWTRQFARNPSAVGKNIVLDRWPYTIVGVMPPRFTGVTPGLFAPDIWIPFTARPGIGPWGETPRAGQNVFNSRYWFCLSVMARLRPGVIRAQARAMADTVFRNFFTADQNPPPKLADLPRVELVSGAKGMDWIRQILGQPLLILMAAVGLVLLIACANVAAMLLARVTSRQREIGMRLSLGASRGRLIRQLLTESVLLASVGGAAGIAFAVWLTRGLETLISSGSFPITIGIQINVPVLGFTAAVAVGTGIVFGLAPAWQASRIELTSALKEKSTGSGTRSRMGLGNWLVVAQVAVCLLLLIGAGLFVRTLDNVENQNLGFEQQGLLLFGVNPTQDGYKGERLVGFYNKLLHHLQALPGVQGATSYEFAPFSGASSNNDIHIEGYTRKLDSMTVRNATVGPDFFKTLGIHMLLGRGIRWGDTGNSPKVAVVTQAMANYFFGGENPIGRQFNIGSNPDPKNTFRIVGVVENVKLTNLAPEGPEAAREVFVPFAQAMDLLNNMYFEVRTAGNPTALVPAVRRVVGDLDPRLPLSNLKTQVQQTRQAAMEQKLFAEISSFFGLVALLLACVGLYGTMSYAVARRTNEIGIRMALGAQRGQVLRMVLWESLAVTGIGIAIGVPVAFGLMRLVSSELYGLKPTDPLTIAGASSLLAIVALVAGYVPAQRASKVDPMVALRYE
jgi:predicted permease